MKPRPRLWALLSILLFIAAAYFWHLGNQRAKQHSGPPDSNPSAPAGKPGAQLEGEAFRLVSGPPIAPTNATASVTNRFRYRLTNTTASLDQLARNDHGVLLRNALIDTSVRGGLAIPKPLRAQGDPEAYIVQSRGVITDAFRKALKTAGAESVSYVPNNAYLVRASAGTAQALATLPFIQSVLPFEPYYKLDPKLLAAAVENQPLPDGARLNVLAFPGQRERALASLTAAGAVLVQEERSPFGQVLTVQTKGGSVAELAQLPTVQVIEPFRERQPANDLARTRIGVTTNTLTGTPNLLGLTGALGLSGSNVLVQVADSGVWAGHPDLAGRVFGATNDAAGHGTHVAGTIASSGEHSPLVRQVSVDTNTTPWVTNYSARGSTNGADFRGMAPSANILSTDFATDEAIQRDAALSTNGRVLICNQSYTYGAPDYDLHAASYDAATRDALLDRTGSQPLLFVCAAGNIGGGDGRGQGGYPDGIQSPGTAKNVITVGAIDQLRKINDWVSNVVMSGMDLVISSNQPWLDMTDSTNEVTSFSSRGNTGIGQEGTYGRFKPDVVAPGAMLISCSITNFPYPTTPTTFPLTRTYQGVFAEPNSTNNFSQTITLPSPYLLSFTVTANATPPVPIWLSMNVPPSPGSFTGNNAVTMPAPPLANGTVRWSIINPYPSNLVFDMTVTLLVTNPVIANSYTEVLSNLNETLDPNHLYRYEWGSSMSAAAVSGTLALMEEYFARDLAITNESPALMKALIINGARNLSLAYDYDARVKANKQGWGLVSLPTTLPAQPASAGSDAAVQFIDQDSTNSLSTGFSHTRDIVVNAASSRSPLRITLVWTDPPANPLVSIKLVNDLDLIVTNKANPNEVYVGNYIADGGIYSQPIGLTLSTNGAGTNTTTSTNLMATNLIAALDIVDNVENIFIPPPLTGPYSVTVRARRVNVNAVDAAVPDSVVQDYALVASVGSIITNNSGLSLAAAPVLGIDTNPIVKGYNTNYVVLVHERVGANPPYLVTTNGRQEQWNFYVFTNSAFGTNGTFYTNVAFATFLPYNIGFLTPNQANPPKPRAREADLDLFVSQNPALTNLDPAALGTADRSVGRFGTERVIYTNAPAGAVYYVGIKSEDQQAADYSFFALASQAPFSSMDSNGNQIVRFIMVTNGVIPDGSPDQPGGATFVGFAQYPMTIQRVTANVGIWHELGGDLIGNLSLKGADQAGQTREAFVVLNNHRVWYGTNYTMYDDSKQGDIVNSNNVYGLPSDGPGSLNSFMGMEATGDWSFDIVDNALQHTGFVGQVTLTISPLIDTNLQNGYSRTIGPQGWLYAVVDVPADATNLLVCVSAIGGAVDLYIRRDAFPTISDYDMARLTTTGGCLEWNIYTPAPPGPLQPGRYFIGVYNPNPTAVDVTLSVSVERNFIANPLVIYSSTGRMALLDDAMTNAVIAVTDHGALAMAQVGVRIEHERASDLVLHLISPNGTRLLLAENRGWTNTQGYGASITNIFTNIIGTIMKDGFEGAAANSNYAAGSFASGWSVDAGTLQIYTAPGLLGLTCDSGTNCADIGNGTISTNLTTKAGTNYLASFAYAMNPDAAGAAATVSVGTNSYVVAAPTNSNLWTNLIWYHTSFVFRAASPLSALQVAGTAAGTAGVLLDSFRVEEILLWTNFFRYCVFTEDPAKAHTPIKFGQPPWANTNQDLTNLIVGSFETAAAGVYDSTAPPFEGWHVLTNKASVVTDPTLAFVGTNVLAVASSQVAYNLPSIPDAEYKLSFACRGPDDVAWWPFNMNPPQDIVSGIQATLNGAPRYVPAKVQDGLALDGLGDHVQVPYTPLVNFGADLGLTIESWIYPTNPADAQPLVEWNDGLVGFIGVNFWISVSSANGGGGPGSLCADLVDSFGGSHQITAPGVLLSNEFQHVAVTYQAWNGDAALYHNGRQVTTTNFGSLPGLSTAYDLWFGVRPVGQPAGGSLFQGVLDEVTFYNRGLSEAEIYGIHHAAGAGKFDPLTPMPNFTVSVPGLFTNTFVAGTNWSVQTLTFVALGTNTPVTFSGLPLGVLIDGVQIVETGNKYYLPEEPLKPMFGQDIFGNWQLEIWDNRLGGQLTNAQLVSWQLQLGTVHTNATPIWLTNHIAFTNTLEGTNLMFFIVDADCTNGGTVTHTLFANAPVDLLFNRFGFPTTTAGDFLLLGNTLAGTNVLDIGGLLLPQPGRYFLALRNTSTTNASFSLKADIDCFTNALPFMLVQKVGSTIGEGGLNMSWTAPSRSGFIVQYTDTLSNPVWNTVSRVVTSVNGVFSYTDPSPALATNRFYRVLQLPP